MGRILGLLFLAAAVAVGVWEIVDASATGYWALKPFGEVFFRLAPEWLNLAQAVIQRYVTPWLWDPAIQTFLLWPAWPVLGGIGAILLIFNLRRRNR